MRELNDNEIQVVNGAGFLRDLVDDIHYTINRLPKIYDDAITATADMMCRGTGRC